MTENPITSNDHHLRRGHGDRILAGVATGLAEYLEVDVTVVRLSFVALTLFAGLGVPLYAAGWLLIPEEGREESIVADLIHQHQPA